MDPSQPPASQDSIMPTQPPPKTQRSRIPEGALSILKKFFAEVSHSPTSTQKDELVARVKIFQGCEEWTRDHCTSWFSRYRRRYASNGGGGALAAVGDGGEGVQHGSPAHKTHKRKKTTGDILYPSLNKKAVTQLEVLIADTPSPIPEIIEIWADRLGATSIDVTTWIKLQRAKGSAPQPSTSGSGSLPRDVEMTAGPSHLPTPAKSTSPETEPHHHHHHHHREDDESNTSSPPLSSSSTYFPISVSGTTQFPLSEVGIKDELALYSPATSRFPPLQPPPPPPPQVTPIYATIPSDAASISSASVVSRMMRNATGDGDEQPSSSPVLHPQPNPNFIASSISQNGRLNGQPPTVPSANTDVVNHDGMAIDPPSSLSAAPSFPSPIRISRELKLGLAAITSTFTPATVTVTDIPDDCPKTFAEFNERFSKYEPIMADFLEKIDNGSLRPFGFEPAPADSAP